MGFLHVCTLYIVHCTLYIVHCTLYIVHCTLYASFYLSLFCLFRRSIMYLTVCLYRSFLSISIYLSFPNIFKDFFAVAGSSLCPGPGVDQADLPVDYSPSYQLWKARYIQCLHWRMYNCKMYIIHYTLYIIHYTLYIIHYTLYIIH